MNNIARNINEAEKFFLENSSGSCICVDGSRKGIAKTYPEAVSFFRGLTIRSKKML